MKRLLLIALLISFSAAAQTTYFVRPTNGSDGAAGTSFATAWQTTQFALDTASTAGDEIRLCAESSETITVQIDDDTNSGTSIVKILVRGMDGSNGTTPAVYTITTGTSISALLNITTTTNYKEFRDIVFDANATATSAATMPTASTLTGRRFIRCRFTDATADGFLAGNANGETTGVFYFACEFDANGSDGYASAAANDGAATFKGCTFHDNTAHGMNMLDFAPRIISCDFYDNTLDGILFSGADNAHVEFCLFQANDSDGISYNASTEHQIILNNTFVSSGAYGQNFASGNDESAYNDYNHYYNNTSGETNASGGTPGDNNQSGDPLFTSVTDGSEDFLPTTGSPLIDNGYPGALPSGGTGFADIGPLSVAASGGGNTIIIIED